MARFDSEIFCCSVDKGMQIEKKKGNVMTVIVLLVPPTHESGVKLAFAVTNEDNKTVATIKFQSA